MQTRRTRYSGLTAQLPLAISALGALGAFAALTLGESVASAQEIQLTGPLAGAPAVRKERLHREGRFEVAPQFAFSLLDEYRQTHALGATIQYNIKDYLSVGVFGFFTLFSPTTDLTDQIDQVAARNSRTAPNVNHTQTGTGVNTVYGRASFADQTSKINYFAGPQLQFAPFRGKIALFQKLFVDTDLYIHGGLAFVGLSERAYCGDTGQKSCSDPASFTLKDNLAIAPTGGLGLSFYTNGGIGFRAEYRALPFYWNRAGFDSAGSGPNGKFPELQTTGTAKVNGADDSFKWNQMITIGVVVAFPFQTQISE